jgi:ATP-dependent DNA helicase RecQ
VAATAIEQNPIDQVAKTAFGIDYLFPFQRLVISNIIEGQDQIVILPTGAGKSLCFSVPAAFLDGPTLIIFPLLALMADQARRLKDTGLGVQILRGGQSKNERDAIFKACAAGKVRYLISNPETLIQESVMPRLPSLSISHMVIDEAHTVAEWGDSFRPTYLKLLEIKESAKISQLSAFTATASEHIMDRLIEILFDGLAPHIVKAVPDRPNIRYTVLPALSKDHELRTLIPKVAKPAIIFCRSRTSAEMTAKLLALSLPDTPAKFYHAGLSKEEKADIESWFFDSDDGVLASTCAYGMGVDKSNIRTVIHRDMPPSVEAYLQESGRAGRDRGTANAILLYSPADRVLSMTEGKPSIEEERYHSMLHYATSGSICRREYLLSLLSAEPEVCFGCDVCTGKVQDLLPGLREILTFAARHPKRFTLGDAALILSGARSRDIANQALWNIDGYAALSGWPPAEIEEAISVLAKCGHLELIRRGPWKRRLKLTRDAAYRRRTRTDDRRALPA